MRLGLDLLVVEDDTLTSIDMEGMLEALGCRVLAVAADPQRAIERIEDLQLEVDGVILDADLAGVSARGVADLLEERAIPYVVVSGHADRALRRMGFDGPVLRKPVRSEEIARALRRFLR